MFSGIVEGIGKIKKIHKSTLAVENHLYNDLKIGESISVNGVCLTVVKFDKYCIFFDLSQETLRVSSFKFLKSGDYVNLERAVKVGDRIGGHYVSGHVDEVGYVSDIKKTDRFFIFTFIVSSTKYIVEKGSVAINGVSLTAFDIKKNTFSVWVIPHTYENTNLRFLRTYSPVNVEYDIIVKSIKSDSLKDNNKITLDFLKDNGFI